MQRTPRKYHCCRPGVTGAGALIRNQKMNDQIEVGNLKGSHKIWHYVAIVAVVFAVLLISLTFAGCAPRDHRQPAPSDLVGAIADEAALMPRGLISEVDESGKAVESTPRYFALVRHMSSPEAGQDRWATTNALQEWVTASGYEDKGARFVAELRKHALLEKASFRIRFIVDAWTISNAVVSVEMSYPERGGQTREWTFANKTGTWVRVKDESKGWWD